jgi:tRNA pseudouridine65 synthase
VLIAGCTVLHDGAGLVAIDKPSGLSVHRGASDDRDTIVDRLRAEGLREVAPVHRLDRGTSGVLLLARNPEAARSASAAWSEGRVGKTYLALVRGAFGLAEIDIDHPIPIDEAGPRVAARSRARGLETIEVEGSPLRERRYSWVEVTPETGRFHQVRRHLKHLGHPVIGDSNYGRGEHNRWLAEHVGLRRLALHASRLVLTMGAEQIVITASLPADLREPLARLGLTGAMG